MLQSRRTIKKRRGRKIFFLISIIFLFFLIISSAVTVYIIFGQNKELFVSPQPRSRQLEMLGDSGTKQLERALVKKGIAFESVTISSESAYIIRLRTGEEILMSKTRGLKEQVSSLQVILPRLTMEDKRFTRLDLRFDKPVIVFK